ncbi:hypothetical protein SFC65_24435 [Priestia filamentosa]|uniref:hypothetical protein n=1 Tax=Priestia filamentosa TaxID=1402861 RepID=UPI003982D40D
MIYEETYQYLLHNVSSTEFDVCLYSLLHTDWDGTIQAPISVIAEKAGTKTKYLRQIVQRFTSYKRRHIFVPVQTSEGTKYKFNLGPTRSLGFSKTDRYCKKYSFFYSESFQNLSINAKRLLLMAAFKMSTLKSESIFLKYNEVVPSRHSTGIPFFTKGRLLSALEEIQSSDLSSTVSVGLGSNIYDRKLIISFNFEKGTLHSFINNNTERHLLRKKIFQFGFQEFLSDEFCIEIEKVGKYLYNSLLRVQKSVKNGVISGAKDELLKLARFIYDGSISRLSKALHSNKHFLTEPKQGAAYFSQVMYDISLEETAKYAHRAESIKSLLNNQFLHKNISETYEGKENVGFIDIDRQTAAIKEKFEVAEHLYSLLKNWCAEWVISRFKSAADDAEKLVSSENEETKETVKQKRNWTSAKEALHFVQSLKNSTYEKVNALMHSLSSLGNPAINKETRTKILKQAKDDIVSYFSIHIDRVANLTAK